LTETEIIKIAGENKIEIIELQSVASKKPSQINVDFVLLRLGVEPNTALFRGQIETDESGYIKINENCDTNLQHVYAIGDVANPLSPTISGASGDGAKVVKIILARDSANAKRR
ncbi:MAG: FAD-dependent oxidoreductase, partial [Pyrinomonadaceae bacterium]|nr:FAD-dependent oxidoreductase [Pyrinomonadaceae bacterium]